MTTSSVETAWQPATWRVWRCDINGVPQEELLDVDFTSTLTLNNIDTCQVTVSGKKPGYFRPWLDSIAVTSDSMYEVFFFGPVVTTSTEVQMRGEYAATTIVDCQSWEGWLDRVYPRVEFSSEGDFTAWQAMQAIWTGGDVATQGIRHRMLKFQTVPTCLLGPTAGTDHKIPIWMEWDTESDETRPGAPSAWTLYQDVQAQGIDVFHRPTWDGAKFTARLVIGGSTHTDPAMWKNPKAGRLLDREYIIGAEVSSLTLDVRGDMQATAVLTSGGDNYYGIAPKRAVSGGEVEWDYYATPPKSYVGLLLETQVDTEVIAKQQDDPEPILAKLAARQRSRLRKPPTFISEMKVRFSPGEIHPGDIVTVASYGGGQVINDEQLAVNWSMWGRVNSLTIESGDALFASVSMYEATDPAAELIDPVPGLTNPSYYEMYDTNAGWTSRLTLGRR